MQQQDSPLPVPPIELPLTLNDMTPAWIAEALMSVHPGVAVRGVTIDRAESGSATHVHVTVGYDGDGGGLPNKLFIKGAFEPHSANLPWIYRHEVRYYNELRPLLDINMPRCLFAASGLEGYPAVVMLEDLESRGVTFCHASKPLSFDQAGALVDGYARFHAPWWGDSRLSAAGELAWLDPQPNSTAYIDSMFEPERWSHYLSLPRGGAIPYDFHDRGRHRLALERVLEFRASQPMVILHGDAHVSNVYLESDGRPGYLDPQCRRGPWFQDVTYFIVSALDPLDRRKWDRALIERYLQRLTEYGVESPPALAEALDAHAREIMRGLFVFAVNSARFQSEFVNTIYSLRFSTAAADWDTYALLLDG